MGDMNWGKYVRVTSVFWVLLALSGCASAPPTANRAQPTTASDAHPADANATAMRAQLTAVIRDQSFLDSLPKDQQGKLISEPFLGHLVVLYMVDEHGAARIAEAEDLRKAEVARAALRAVVQWNLATLLPSVASCERDAVTAFTHGNYYESSRLLLDQQWSDLAAKKGNVVVAVPSNDALFVACDPSPAVLQKLTVTVQNTYPHATRPISQSLLGWSNGSWQELKPP